MMAPEREAAGPIALEARRLREFDKCASTILRSSSLDSNAENVPRRQRRRQSAEERRETAAQRQKRVAVGDTPRYASRVFPIQGPKGQQQRAAAMAGTYTNLL